MRAKARRAGGSLRIDGTGARGGDHTERPMKNSRRFPVRVIAWAIVAGNGVGAEAGAAEEKETLPGIFAPKRVVEPAAPPTLLARRPATSDKVSAMIKERVAERARAMDGEMLPIVRREGEVSAVVMEAFTVKADKVRRVDPDEKLSPAARFLKTGRFFESPDGTVTGDARLLPVRPAGALPKEEVMRVEVSFTKKF